MINSRFTDQLIDRLLVVMLVLLIFFIPTNWFFKFAIDRAYIHGYFSDYLLQRLYPTDLIGVVILLIFVFSFCFITKNIFSVKFTRPKTFIAWLLFALLGLGLVIRSVLSTFPAISITQTFRLIGAGLVILVARRWLNQLNQLNQTKLMKWLQVGLIFTLLTQSLIGLFQFFYQRSIWGYALLGEPQLAKPIGIVHADFLGVDKILPYGTTPHPNFLGGVLVIYLVLLWLIPQHFQLQAKWLRLIKYLATLASFLCLLLTGSLTSLTAGLLVLLTWLVTQNLPTFKKITPKIFFLFWLLVIVTFPLVFGWLANGQSHNSSFFRRQQLNQLAAHLIWRNPIWGVGNGLFTAHFDDVTLPKLEPVLFLQPVHNTLLLFTSQAGIFGLVWLIIFGYLVKHQKSHNNLSFIPSVITLALLTPIFSLDHYLLSLTNGLYLLILILILTNWGNSNNPKN